MSITVASILLRVLQNVCDAGNYSASTNTYILGLLNQTHAELCTDCKIVGETSTVINLVSGTAEYALTDAIVRVWGAAYIVNGSDPGTDLNATLIDQQDESLPSWKDSSAPTGIPTTYYIDGNQIGFYPVPNTTTSAGFPNITVYGDSFTALTAGASLPSQIQPTNIDAWTYGVCRLHVAARTPELFELFDGLYQAEKEKLLRVMAGRTTRATRRPYRDADEMVINAAKEGS